MSGLTPPPPQAIVIFGASGDLTRRKILPALYNLAARGMLPEHYAVVGYARSDYDDDAFRALARQGVEEFSRTPLDEAVFGPFADSLSFASGSFEGSSCFLPLDEHLARIDDTSGTEGRRLYYCATPPSAFPVIARRLGECRSQEKARIVIEKPFGRDLATAGELGRTLHEVFEEPQIFRIDHYLGKETVQNVLMFRFANSVFERLWNREAIDHVQITIAESVGMEGRGRYYEEAGAIRDMVQNHLLQVLSFVAMEPPRSLKPEAIRDEKVKLLLALRPFEPADVVRGRYTAGISGGEQVGGYLSEEGVAPASDVETFVAVRAHIDNWRWDGVPFFLRTGKRLPSRATEVAVFFREAPAYLFEGAGIHSVTADHLTIRVQPSEGISFVFQAKEPGPAFTPKPVRMDFSYETSFAVPPAEAYERLLHDAMAGDHTLFTRQDGVERAWEIVAPVLDRPGPVHPYPAGSWGPPAAERLIAPRAWHLR